MMQRWWFSIRSLGCVRVANTVVEKIREAVRTVNVSNRPDFFLGEMLVGLPMFLEQVEDIFGRSDFFKTG